MRLTKAACFACLIQERIQKAQMFHLPWATEISQQSKVFDT